MNVYGPWFEGPRPEVGDLFVRLAGHQLTWDFVELTSDTTSLDSSIDVMALRRPQELANNYCV